MEQTLQATNRPNLTMSGHAPESYPDQAAERKALIQMLRVMLDTHSAPSVVSAIQHYASNRGDMRSASQARTAARAMLKRLGESS